MSSFFPYPGLRPFRREESDIFFGREKQTDQLLEKLDQTRFLSVVGESGCGKSSLVRAGMIAGLEAGFVVSAGARWRIAKMRPGNHPLQNLAEVLIEEVAISQEGEKNADSVAFLLATLSRGPLGLVEAMQEISFPENTNLLLLVDQFEEIFRYPDPYTNNEFDAFVALLLTSASQTEIPIYVVITMRSDFLGDCAMFTDLPEAINEGQFLTPRLTREQRKASIVGPAGVFGGHVESDLVNRLLNDMGPGPDQLPLLQHVLMRMWNCKLQASGKYDPALHTENPEPTEIIEDLEITLTLSDYLAAGGLSKALSIHADECFVDLNDEQQGIAETMFRCLSERIIRDRDTRHPVPLASVADVAEVSPGQVMNVVEVFRRSDRSFVTPPSGILLTPDTILDISHESLIRQWDKMNQWADKEADSAEKYRRLEQTALLWKDRKAALWTTPDLENALEWKKRENPTSSWARRYGENYDFAMEFLEASEKNWNEKRLKEENIQRREIVATYLMRLVVVLVVAIIFAAGAAIYAKTQQEKAENEREKTRKMLKFSTAQRLAYEAIIQAEKNNHDYDEKEAMLTRQALLFSSDSQVIRNADFALRKVFSRPYFCNILAGYKGKGIFTSIAFDPEGKTLVAVCDDGVIGKWDLKNGNQFKTLKKYLWQINAVSIAPDGKNLALADDDGTVMLLDLKSGDEIKKYTEHEGRVTSVSFSPDGRTLASGSYDMNVIIWDLKGDTHKKLEGHTGEVNSVLFSPDGRMLATAGNDNTVRIWDTERFMLIRELKGHEQGVSSVSFSSDNKILASAGKDWDIRQWDIESGTELQKYEGHTGWVRSVSFSPNGQLIASASNDGTVRLWDRKNCSKIETFDNHNDWVTSVSFSPDGKVLASAGYDYNIRLWSLKKPPAKPREIGVEEPVNMLLFTPNDKTLASVHSDNSIRVWNLETKNPPKILKGHEGSVNFIAISPDGEKLASGSSDHTIRIWNLNNNDPHVVLKGHKSAVTLITFNSDGNKLASGSEDNIIRLWDLRSGNRRSIKVLKESEEHNSGRIISMSFINEGTTLAFVNSSGIVRLFDMKSGYYHDQFEFFNNDDEGTINYAMFSPDGAKLALAIVDKENIHKVILWNYKNTKKPILWKQRNLIMSLAFNPSGDKLAWASDDGTVSLRDLDDLSGQPIIFKDFEQSALSLVFSHNGNLLASAGEDKKIVLKIISTEILSEFACENVRRNLELDEWQNFIGGEFKMEKTCSNLPIHQTIIEATHSK